MVDLEGHVLYLLRGQFNYMYFQYQSLINFDTPLMKPVREAHQCTSHVALLHFTFNQVPHKNEVFMNAHLTKDFTAGLNHMRDAYEKANDIFIEGTDRAVAALDTKSASYIDDKKKLLGYAGAMMGLKFDYAAFDRRVSWAQGEIQRYRDQINKIENKTWDENVHAAFAKLADEEKEKLIQDLIELRRAGCAIRECECIDREKIQNAVTDGAGTQARNKIDRENVQALLAGEEPWKEEMEEWEERRRAVCPQCQKDAAQS